MLSQKVILYTTYWWELCPAADFIYCIPHLFLQSTYLQTRAIARRNVAYMPRDPHT